MRIIKFGEIVNMEGTFSNNHCTPSRYIIQIYHPSFDDEPMYLSKCGKKIWNIAWDSSIWKAKTFKYEKLAEREANRCKNLIVEGAQKGWRIRLWNQKE